MSDLKLLRPEDVLLQRERLSDTLAPALAESYGECSMDDVVKLVLSGRMFLFASDDFAVTCEFIHYPKSTVMVVGFGAGTVPERGDVAEILIDFAKRGGATSIRTYCKNPAMVRYYRRWFNLNPVYTVLEKPL